MPARKKSLDVVDIADAKAKVSDIQVVGNGDAFQLLCKASSKAQGWMKSTKAMYIEGVGCLVQCSTQQGDNVAEALVFVPGVYIVDDINIGGVNGKKLQSFNIIDEPSLSRPSFKGVSNLMCLGELPDPA